MAGADRPSPQKFQTCLFGTPTPVRSEANLGVLKADQVNIVAHGHEPVLSEMILAAAADPALVARAKAVRRRRHQRGGHVLYRQ